MSSEFGAEGGDELDQLASIWDDVPGDWGFDDLDNDDWYVDYYTVRVEYKAV